MGRDRAAYMREYRAAKRAAHERYDEAKPLIGHLKTVAQERADRIAELEAEVARLKRELTARPTIGPGNASFNTRPFTPVPKHGK